MTVDGELDTWREQWNSIPGPPAEFQRKVQQRIKREDRYFLLGNLLTGIAFLGMLIFAVYLRHQTSSMGPGWATGLCVLVFVSAGYRVWVLRGTWRPQTQSTRAFVELWHKRVAARVRLLRICRFVCGCLDYFLCGTYGCELENHWPGREGSSQGLGGVAGGLRAHTAGDLVLGGLATASKTGRTERSKKNSG